MEPSNSSKDFPDPLRDWHDLFRRQLSIMTTLRVLRTHPEDNQARDNMFPQMSQISSLVQEINRQVEQFQEYTAKENAALAATESLRRATKARKEHMRKVLSSLPPDLVAELEAARRVHGDENVPGERIASIEKVEGGYPDRSEQRLNVERNTPRKNIVKSVSRGIGERPTPVRSVMNGGTPRGIGERNTPRSLREESATRRNGSSSMLKGPRESLGARGGARKSTKDVGKSAGKKVKGEIPVIQGLSEEELAKAPQYVRGRLTMAKIEDVRDSLNTIALKKYRLLRSTYRELSASDKDTYMELRENECDETQGRAFLTEGEIKGFGKMRLDSTAKSVINILRHVGSLKQVRGKNKANILLIN